MVALNAKQLMRMGPVEIPYLWEPFLPKEGIAVIAGKPDVGKSQFARQLSAYIAMAEKEFLGRRLSSVHRSAICVLTEDNDSAVRVQLPRHFKTEEVAPEGLRFIFAEDMNRKEILASLKKELEVSPADLIVVDSFGDVFLGHDSNSNVAMRRTLKPFLSLATEFKCLILFVHHVNKAAYDKSPGQEHIQGGSGLTQKVRTAMVLRDGDGDKRYLWIVKSNYTPKHLKKSGIELRFNEETLWFTQTGNTVDSSVIEEFTLVGNETATLVAVFNGEERLRHAELIRRYRKETNVSSATGKRHVKTFVQDNKLQQRDGYYYLTPEAELG